MNPRECVHPGRSLEKTPLETYDYVDGPDEVNRGALAGLVSVGLAVVARRIDDDSSEGLVDSKQLAARVRTVLIRPARGWLVDHAVAHTSPVETDEHGIIGALRAAGLWVLQQVADRGHAPDATIPDDVVSWLTAPQPDLLTTLENTHALKDSPEPAEVPPTLSMHMEVKVDTRCAVVAAASILTKVERDCLMANLDDSGYGWTSNKGYASPAHIQGLTSLGASDQRRYSWHLPGLDKRHR